MAEQVPQEALTVYKAEPLLPIALIKKQYYVSM